MALNFEQALQKVNDFITLSSEDRKIYTADFDRIRHYFRKHMRLETAFDKLYSRDCLAGSYADKLKVSRPDEFDLVLEMELPEMQLIDVQRVQNMGGFVTINIKKMLEHVTKQKPNDPVLHQLNKLIDKDGYLNKLKIQSWIEGVFTKVLNGRNRLCLEGHSYEIEYKKTGPAHTFDVVGDARRQFSIDFVPAFVFGGEKWTAKRKCPVGATSRWIAVPKPIFNGQEDVLAFITSYVDTERYIIRGKQNLKNTLRMVKKLRDQHGISKLKSYHIKTVYLYEAQTYDWHQSTGDVFLYMLDRVIDYIEQKNLPFFWDESCNMFGNLKENQLKSLESKLKDLRKNIHAKKVSNPEKIFQIFGGPAALSLSSLISQKINSLSNSKVEVRNVAVNDGTINIPDSNANKIIPIIDNSASVDVINSGNELNSSCYMTPSPSDANLIRSLSFNEYFSSDDELSGPIKNLKKSPVKDEFDDFGCMIAKVLRKMSGEEAKRKTIEIIQLVYR